MKTIRVLSTKYWPAELVLDYWRGGLRISTWLAGHNDVGVLEVTVSETHRVRASVYGMVRCTAKDLLKAGYFYSPYLPLMSMPVVKFSGLWYTVGRTQRAVRKWFDNAFKRMGM